MRFVVVALAASVAFGQTSSVLQLTQNENKQEMAEITTLLRATAGIHQVSVDDTKMTVTVEGTAEQIAMAAWLLHQIDLPAGPYPGVHEYRPPTGGDDVVRVFYVSYAATPQALQEIAATLRSVADIPRIFVYNPLRAVAVRGTNQQISLGAWLVEQVNQAAKVAAPSPHEYQLPGGNVARVFDLTYPETPQQLQEIVTLIRTIGDIPRLFIYNTRRAVVLRATAEQAGLAAWLVGELDKPVNEQGAAREQEETHEYRLSSGPDNLVRVFYLPSSESAPDLMRVATRVRDTAQTPRVFVYNARRALALRGTVGQVATAEQVIKEMKAP